MRIFFMSFPYGKDVDFLTCSFEMCCIVTLSGKWLRFNSKRIYKAFRMLCVVPVLYIVRGADWLE